LYAVLNKDKTPKIICRIWQK